MSEPVVGAVAVLATLLSGVGAAACAREGDRVDTEPGRVVGVPGPDSVEGRVRRVGNLPFARTILEDGGSSVALVGPYATEVGRVAGALVRATGEGTPGGLGPELRVGSYEILSVSGERPHVGLLAREEGDGGYRLEDPEGGRLTLRAAPEVFAALLGARLWVITDPDGVVVRYGVLRRPGERIDSLSDGSGRR